MESETSSVNKIVILHDIRSVHNVGSIFRTCDAIGVDIVYLTGITPSPYDRFGRKRSDFAKVALGAENSVKWVSDESIQALLKKLKKEGIDIIAVEQDDRSMDYKDIQIKDRIAFLFGSEPDGLSQEVVDKCDKVIDIPMRGEKESLNVGVAAGIVLYRLLDV